MPNDFFIPQVTPLQIEMIAMRGAGEIATVLAAEARMNAPRTNPFIRGVATIQKPSTSSNQFTGKIDQATFADPELYPSDLGTSVFADVTFESITYQDATGKDVVTPNMVFQSILVNVSFPRNIVKTQIQGRNGTVKEYIGEDDAIITFKGIITGRNGQYPAAQIYALRQMIKAPYAIPVTSTHLQNLGIYSVVFEDSEFEQEEGSYSYQVFSLNAVSDIPQELQISGNV